ncbi:MAG: DNA repair exonuclease [Pirellulaceae bacterium]|nr:DNA repair exonuclease [Pirellulaceae bacterium]
MKFIHAADLHIDSPLRGLAAYAGAPFERLQGATRQALQNLVRVAVEQAVDFVVIAGDLFDGKWPDMQTGLWTASQFRVLQRAGIRVYIVQGNHDAASRVPATLTWPDNVHVFAVDRPETVLLDDCRVALHGQGFARESETQDLASAYPAAVPGYFNVGILHTSLTGHPEHDTYAATSLDVLLQRGYDYWALGHIHARSVPPLSDRPFVAFAGNLQGRHVRETGAKGCLLASVEHGELTDVTFVETDVVRWQVVEINPPLDGGRAELLAAVRRALSACHAAAAGRMVAVRVVLQGASAVHHDLVHEASRAEVLAEIRNLANDVSEDVWVEKIVLATRPPLDLDELLRGRDMLGELLRCARELAGDPARLIELVEPLSTLREKAAWELHESDAAVDDPRRLADWLRQAEALLIARLTEDEA